LAYIGNTPAEFYQTLEKQSFTTSATTTYTLNFSVTNPQEIALFINNIRQNPNSSYTVSNLTTLTLSSATSSSDVMYAVFLGKSVGTIGVPAGGVGTSQIIDANITTAKIADSAVTSAKLASGLLPTNTPAFEAHLSSNASFNTNTSTKITFDTEIYDTDSKYSTSTGKFIPAVAGKYFVYTSVTTSAGATNNVVAKAQIYVNGSAVIISSFNFTGNYISQHVAIAQGVLVLDADDEVEVYGRCLTSDGASGIFEAGNRSTMFGAYKIIGA